MHPFFERLRERARAARHRIVFAEGDDPRVIAAAQRLKVDGLAEPVLISKYIVPGIETIDPAVSPRFAAYAAHYHRRRASKGVTEAEAEAISRQPLCFAALMVAMGDAYGSLGGCVCTTAETVRAAITAIGPAPRITTVSSAFLMAHPDRSFGVEGIMTFADCAVVVDPNPEQ